MAEFARLRRGSSCLAVVDIDNGGLVTVQRFVTLLMIAVARATPSTVRAIEPRLALLPIDVRDRAREDVTVTLGARASYSKRLVLILREGVMIAGLPLGRAVSRLLCRL